MTEATRDNQGALTTLPRYDPTQSYLWNYEHPPRPVEVEVAKMPGVWKFCGLKVDSPLGIPAGPLLNGRWVLYYAALGFDVLTYKTVRSRSRACYPLPNLLPVQGEPLSGDEDAVPASETGTGSWAVSFGMPSMAPEVWRADVEWTRRQLPPGKLLSVSVVGTAQPDWTIGELAADYAQCAGWALESGADAIEANFSCPNVATCDGQLFQQPAAAALVAARIRDAIGRAPLILKIGHVREPSAAAALVAAVRPFADALAMTNTISTTIESHGKPLFDGQRRGIAGPAIRDASIAQVRLFAAAIAEHGWPTRLIGVGGAGSAADVRAYLSAGAESVHLATSAMLNPRVGLEIRAAWGGEDEGVTR